ncbi:MULTISPECIES: hypothetical protein [Bacillaceae]|uniref:hypothetical protein n=1 Tax=Bacillaceae TaxID=186817 RepID=UPI0014049B2B|nr:MULTISPECIES: hypothetical protein [Bacillaceae]MDT2046817.1 hypothetical protein [Priestia flexa]USY57042.1 hypothetical protein NIZ91_10455 [Bacillus sp. 1780r2a1]
MIYNILLALASLIFVVNFFIAPTFFHMEVDDSGTFVGLMLLIIVLKHLLDKKDA